MERCENCGRIYPKKTYIRCPDCLNLNIKPYNKTLLNKLDNIENLKGGE